MKIFAHRGWHGPDAPENGMEAFRRAAERGFGIETDLRTDATGRIVLVHDRLVGGEPVDALSGREIERRTGRRVWTLAELLEADLTVPLNLEVKTRAAWIALAPSLERGLPPGVLLSSFVHAIPIEAADRHGIEAAYLMASAPPPDRLPAARPHLASVVWDFNIVDGSLLADAQRSGLEAIVYGAWTADEHRRVLAWDCAAVITDRPDLAAQVLEERGRNNP